MLFDLSNPPLPSIRGGSELGEVAKDGVGRFDIVRDAGDGLGTGEAQEDEEQADEDGAHGQACAWRGTGEQVDSLLKHL